MPRPATLLFISQFAAMSGCVPPEYRSADELGTRSGTTPEILPLRGLPGLAAAEPDGSDADRAELDARNAALALRRGALETNAGVEDSGALLGRAEDLRSRADALRSRE